MENYETKENVEHQFNKVVLSLLGNLDSALKEHQKSPLVVHGEEVFLTSESRKLVTVTSSDIAALGRSFQDVLGGRGSEEPFRSEKFKLFLDALAENLVGLNHLGISYFVEDIDRETEAIRRLAQAGGVGLYSENASPEGEKWLFVGNTANLMEPLFEFVLNKGKRAKDLWRPHFQIDIDTKLSRDAIKRITDKYLGEDFIKWELDIPNHGIVLVMGIIGDIGGTKIALGIGTDKRDTKRHREFELKKIS